MFANGAKKLTKQLIYSGVVHESDFDLYSYGFEIGFAMLANVLTTLAIGFIFRMPLESGLFLIAFIPLRSYAGGFHALDHFRCYWLSVVSVVTTLFAVRYVYFASTKFILCIGFFCFITMLILVPVQDANRPLEEIEIRVYGRRAKIILCLEFISLILASIIKWRIIVSVLLCTICLAFISTCAGAIKNYIKQKG